MLLVIITALIPAVILGWWIYQKDSLRPEPLNMLIKAFLYGVGSTFVTLVITQLLGIMGLFVYDLGSFSGAVSTALFAAALPEELAKLLMLWLLLRKNPYYDEYFDGIVYAACVGLGFAATEHRRSCPLCHRLCHGLFLQQAPLRRPLHYHGGLCVGGACHYPLGV